MKTNNHKKEKNRPLGDAEKYLIQAEFLKLDGRITHDALLNLKSRMPDEISIFQVTGWVVALHQRVRKGFVALKNLDAYKEFMRMRRMEWSTWNSPKYNQLRDRMVLGGMTV
jgi:hypothetical protein